MQDPIFGINHANIVPSLTPQNCRTKAIVLGRIYIWVVRGTVRNKYGKDVWRYCVRLYNSTGSPRIMAFAKRDSALRYANTFYASKGPFPAEQGNQILISS